MTLGRSEGLLQEARMLRLAIEAIYLDKDSHPAEEDKLALFFAARSLEKGLSEGLEA